MDNSSTASDVKTLKRKITFEDILEASGGFGVFQFLVLFALLLPEIPAAFVAFAPVFVGGPPSSWVCENGTTSFLISNSEDVCSCPGSLTSPSDLQSSIVTEWALVCGTSWVSDFITSIQMLGMLTGSLLSSQISDWYGRKWVYFGVCLLMGFGQALSSLASEPVLYSIARFFAGAGISGFMGVSTVYPLEFMTSDWRLLIGSVGPWGEGIMLLALLAYFVRKWRELLFLSSLPFILVLAIVPFIPESPRWLIRNGKIPEAVKVIQTIQKVNCKTELLITNEILEEIRQEELGQSTSDDDKFNNSSSGNPIRFSYLDFFRAPELRRKTLLLMGIWFSWALVYFGLSYNVKNLRGGPYLNMAFMGLSDALGYPAALLINNKLGRRKSLVIFMTIGAIFLVALAFLELFYGSVLSAVAVALLCLCGKFGVAGARSAARMLTGESFPTAIRTMGYGISGVTAGVGGIIAPQIAYIGSLWWSPLPFVTFALISMAGSLLSLLLPETAGKDLQERVGLIPTPNAANKNYQSGAACNSFPQSVPV